MVLLAEVIVLCPSCKNLEFLYITNGRIKPCSAYHRSNGHVYHRQCEKPCRFFYVSLTRAKVAVG